MNDDYEIISTIPANPGWWIEYTDPQDDGGAKWYVPVIAWARCRIPAYGNSGMKDCGGLFPVVDGLEGMFVPDITGNGVARYLPDVQFTPSTVYASGAYYPVIAETAK